MDAPLCAQGGELGRARNLATIQRRLIPMLRRRACGLRAALGTVSF